MRVLKLHDQGWLATFPNRVTPYLNEWFAGLLLRCDEVNQWASGLTLAHLKHTYPTKHYGSSVTDLICPPAYILNELAELLAIPTNMLLPTTYQSVLARLFGAPNQPPKRLALVSKFRVCPECLASARLLQRTLALPQINFCPRHHVMLVKACPCGAALHPFSQKALPFTCSMCGLDWAKLPCVQASPEAIVAQNRYLSCYAFFFSQGTRNILERTLRHLGVKLREKRGDDAFWKDVLFPKWWGVRPTRPDQYQTVCSLSMVVDALVHFNLSPHEINSSDAPLFGDGVEWGKLYYYAIVKMISRLDDDTENSS